MSDFNTFIASIPRKDQGFGELNEAVTDDLDTIGALLAKRGTLQVETLDYKALGDAATRVLAHYTHLNALRGLILSKLWQAKSADIIEAIDLASHLFSNLWPELPPTDKRAARLKTAWIKDILLALGEASASEWVTEAHVAALETLATLVTEQGVDAKPLTAAMNAPRKTATSGSATKDTEQTGSTASSARLGPPERAALRRDMLQLAERINRHDTQAALPYAMRCYAAWMEFIDLPDHNEDGIVSQNPLPLNTRTDLLSEADQPTARGLTRIEDRLAQSPDWFAGHEAAEKIARALGYQQVAEAIRNRCIERIVAFPKLLDLHYQNGERFVPDGVAAWGKPQVSISGDADIAIGTSIHDFDAALAEAKSPRDAALIRLAFCRAAVAENRNAVAKLVLNGLQVEIETLTATQWDFAIANEMKQLEKVM